MPSPLSFWQELLLVGLAAVGLVYVLYFRIWLALAVGADVLFLVAMLAATVSIAMPEPFLRLASELVDRSPLPAALQAADDRVAAIASMPAELVDAALEKIGYERTDEDEDEPPTPPEPGLFVSSIRPSVDGLVAVVVRSATLVASGLMILTSLATRASTTTARRLSELDARLLALEAPQSSSADAEPEAGSA